MGSSYIPTTDQGARAWMQTFATNIAADPSRYMLAAADAANITEVVDTYVTALATATNELTRTKGTILAKDQSRNFAIELCRSYAIQIKYNAGVEDEDKVNIGVKPVNPSRSPVPPPTTSPLVNAIGVTQGSQTVRYADSMTPETGRKPVGVTQLLLYVVVSDEPTTDFDAAQFYGAFTKNPVGVAFDHADDGKVATYFARWQTGRGDLGPWSFPVSMRIAA